MKISLKWLSEMVDLRAIKTSDELSALLTNRGLEVEEIKSLSQGFEKVRSAQILERLPHPQADRLSLCKVTTGRSGERLEIVCGANNMKAGDKVALAEIGARLPNGMLIEQSKIRGVVSNGMLCSEEELGLKASAASSEGILILPSDTEIGVGLAQILGLDDTILTLKLTANRGDCLSHFGLAREVAAATHTKLTKPKITSPMSPTSPSGGGGECPFSLRLEAGEAAPQFWGCYIEGVNIAPSPKWVVKRLEAIGMRSINNVVDATNLVMLETGHPMHAYDADRLQGKEISVRFAKTGEQLPLLDGQTISLDGFELVISDGPPPTERAIALAGVMGGGNCEVEPSTTRILLECAEFLPSLVRRAAMRHERRSEAAHRFERGVDPLGLEWAISRLAELIVELSGGVIRGLTVSRLPSREILKGRQIDVTPAFFNAFLGTNLLDQEIEAALKAQGCELNKLQGGPSWQVSVPSYRHDLAIAEDLAEEVARSIGYDKIPATIPTLSSEPTVTTGDPLYTRYLTTDLAKNALLQAGLMETVNLAFTSSSWLKRFSADTGDRNWDGLKVQNPLSEEYDTLVPSLIPGLVRNALDNGRHHFGSEPLAIRLFELRPTFHASGKIAAQGETETGVLERYKLGILISGPRMAEGLRQDRGEVDFFDLKAVIETLFGTLATRGIRYQPLNERFKNLLHPGQSVVILAGKEEAGYMGMLHPAIASDLKAKSPVWIAELDWEAILRLSRPLSEPRPFKPWPEFPPMERDFALIVKADVSAERITQIALKVGKPLVKLATIFDVYKGSQVLEGMTSVAVRVIFFNETRCLQESETEQASSKILEAWRKELGAELRS